MGCLFGLNGIHLKALILSEECIYSLKGHESPHLPPSSIGEKRLL